MRADVAYFGTFGYELNPNSLTEAEREAIKKQTAFMKEHRSLIQYGTFYRLQSPFAGNEMAWMVVSEDKKEAIVGWYRFLEPINIGYRSVRLQGLDPKLPYQISDMEMALYGDELMQAGLIVSDVASGQNPEQYNGENGDFQSRLYLLKAKGRIKNEGGGMAKELIFSSPSFLLSDTQKDLDRSLYGMPWKKKSCWNIRRIGNILDGQAA